MSDMPIIQPIKATDNVLGLIGRKMSMGMDLTISERLMAISAAAATTADRYGPGPENMQLKQPELPEAVKGVIANYMG